MGPSHKGDPLIAYFANDLFLGSVDTYKTLPSYHFFCPSCGEVWGRFIAEPGDFHRIEETWCAKCARSNEQGIWDGVLDVYYFPEYLDDAPKAVHIHNFMQVYDNRLRLDGAGVKVDSTVRYWPDYSELLARLKEST